MIHVRFHRNCGTELFGIRYFLRKFGISMHPLFTGRKFSINYISISGSESNVYHAYYDSRPNYRNGYLRIFTGALSNYLDFLVSSSKSLKLLCLSSLFPLRRPDREFVIFQIHFSHKLS